MKSTAIREAIKASKAARVNAMTLKSFALSGRKYKTILTDRTRGKNKPDKRENTKSKDERRRKEQRREGGEGRGRERVCERERNRETKRERERERERNRNRETKRERERERERESLAKVHKTTRKRRKEGKQVLKVGK